MDKFIVFRKRGARGDLLLMLGIKALDHARTLFRQRRARDARFSPDTFGEPAWDLLLTLYIARCEGHRVSMLALCPGLNLPPAEALDWISKLEDSHLVQRDELTESAWAGSVRISDGAFDSLTMLLLQQRGTTSN